MAEDDDEELQDAYVGRILDGRYRLTRRLGAGGMGAVYEAEHEQIGRKLAVKILHPQYASDREVMQRFKNEARASGTLGHPNIVEAIDFGRTGEGAPYMVMELLDGRDLGEAIQEDGPFRIDRAIAIADQIADALGAAHAKGIVHRDMKPENVFLTGPKDRVKILDFGISKFSESDSSIATKTGAIMGSPHYMAPEQVRDSSKADVRTDVYSLGAVLYKMLSGRTVFPNQSLPMLVVAITRDPPQPITELREDIPPALASFIARTLAKDPKKRPQSMKEARQALAAFEAVDATPRLSQPVDGDPGVQTTPFSTEMADSRVELPTKSRTATFAIGAAVLVGALALTAWGLGGPGQPQPPDASAAAPSADEPDEVPEPAIPLGADLPTASSASDAGADATTTAEVDPRELDRPRTRTRETEPRTRETEPRPRVTEPRTQPRPTMRPVVEAPMTSPPRVEPPPAVDEPAMVPVMTTMRIDGVPIDDTY